MGGQTEQKTLRRRMADGSLLNTGWVAGFGALAIGAGRGTATLASFAATAPAAAMPRKLAHRATTAKSTAQRYLRKMVSTAVLGKSNSEAKPGRK